MSFTILSVLRKKLKCSELDFVSSGFLLELSDKFDLFNLDLALFRIWLFNISRMLARLYTPLRLLIKSLSNLLNTLISWCSFTWIWCGWSSAWDSDFRYGFDRSRMYLGYRSIKIALKTYIFFATLSSLIVRLDSLRLSLKLVNYS